MTLEHKYKIIPVKFFFSKYAKEFCDLTFERLNDCYNSESVEDLFYECSHEIEKYLFIACYTYQAQLDSDYPICSDSLYYHAEVLLKLLNENPTGYDLHLAIQLAKSDLMFD